MMKRNVVRLLLFGIPFGLSYWATRPAPPVPQSQPLVVCAFPGDRPGELRIHLDPAACSETQPALKGAAPVSIFPAITSGERSLDRSAKTPLSIGF
jgi:hypothetical protein